MRRSRRATLGRDTHPSPPPLLPTCAPPPPDSPPTQTPSRATRLDDNANVAPPHANPALHEAKVKPHDQKTLRPSSTQCPSSSSSEKEREPHIPHIPVATSQRICLCSAPPPRLCFSIPPRAASHRAPCPPQDARPRKTPNAHENAPRALSNTVPTSYTRRKERERERRSATPQRAKRPAARSGGRPHTENQIASIPSCAARRPPQTPNTRSPKGSLPLRRAENRSQPPLLERGDTTTGIGGKMKEEIDAGARRTRNAASHKRHIRPTSDAPNLCSRRKRSHQGIHRRNIQQWLDIEKYMCWLSSGSEKLPARPVSPRATIKSRPLPLHFSQLLPPFASLSESEGDPEFSQPPTTEHVFPRRLTSLNKLILKKATIPTLEPLGLPQSLYESLDLTIFLEDDCAALRKSPARLTTCMGGRAACDIRAGGCDKTQWKWKHWMEARS
ncbi:hypothetical protein B0H11DRAFT_1901710 [Mycena galericulata]|nr:hypothetical protein B0H11DRAFT_1901710 [Mycena galericulata]